jgi:hypothetical protein
MVYTNSGSKLISRFIGACEIFAGFPPGSFALSVLGTVARNSNDPKLRREAYDAIENLTLERSSVEKLDPYDKLEIFCLQAASTPCQYFRQKNLSYIARYATDDVLGHEVASKLLALSRMFPIRRARLTCS